MFESLTDLIKGKAPLGAKRSRFWAGVRAEHLVDFPRCEVCGGKAKLSVHHIQPFHTHPSLELVPANLMTLCESKKRGIHCHLLIGHLGNFRKINPVAVKDAGVWRLKLSKT